VDLAIFDFDGTVTVGPTYPGFISFAVPPSRKIIGGALLSPWIVAYHARLISDRSIRIAISRVAFWLADPDRVLKAGEAYAREKLPGLIRQDAIDRIAWHKRRGDRVVIVSATLDVYLTHWCASMKIDVICTRLELSGGILTGRYRGGDCSGSEKARRLRRAFRLDDFAAIYAYGDTEEDREMLDLADKKYFRWKEVDQISRASRTGFDCSARSRLRRALTRGRRDAQTR